MTTTQPACLLDETALKETLEGIPEPGRYFEIVHKTGCTLPFSLKLFPAIRTLFKTDTFTITRVYIGSATTSEAQYEAIEEAFIRSNNFHTYEEIFHAA